MVIKRKPGKLKEGIKKIIKRIEEMPFDNRPASKPSYIELKTFAALGGVKGATKRARRRVMRAAKDRLKHGLLSPEAVERVTNREVARATEKASTPLKQDIRGAITNTKTSIINTPQNLKTAAIKTKDIAKNIYENTGDVTAKTAGWARKNPELFVGDVVVGLASKPAAFAINPALGTALMASPVGPGKVATAAGYAMRKSPNKVVTFRGKKMTQRRKRVLQGKETEAAIQRRLGGKSIKGAVENIKTGITSLLPAPTSPQAIPSYRLARVTM